MSQNQPKSLSAALAEAGNLAGRFLVGSESSIALGDFVNGSALYSRGEELRGRCVLLTTREQFTTASALIELDGLARRIVICPPDLSFKHIPFVIDAAGVDAIVSDHAMPQLGKPRPMYFSPCSRTIVPGNGHRAGDCETEWILLTSGTTGIPKLVVHTLASLTGAIQSSGLQGPDAVWSTFYDIRRYGGLQIFLRAVLGGNTLVLSDGQEATANFLDRVASHQVTHISGTPSHWRRALMSPSARLIAPTYVRLSGESVEQGLINKLRSIYPQARIAHAFASTEAGVAFEVNDALAGFPSAAIDNTAGVEMKVEDRTLRIRSTRTATQYLGENAQQLRDAEGYVDTGDFVELRDGRYHFAGRRDGVINVGGLKIHPEEVEAVINRHPEVEMSLVRTKGNPITGALVVADVVLKGAPPADRTHASTIQNDILLLCRETLSSHKVPAAIHFVSGLPVAESGKVLRRDA